MFIRHGETHKVRKADGEDWVYVGDQLITCFHGDAGEVRTEGGGLLPTQDVWIRLLPRAMCGFLVL